MKTCTSVLILILLVCFSTKAQTYSTETGYVQFLSDAPLEKFVGKSSFLTGSVNLDSSYVDFYIDMNTVETGINLRDEHMRENYLETEEFPFAEFSGRFSPAIDVANADTQLVTVTGNFTIHGVTNPMEIPGKIVAKKGAIHIRADFVVKLSDHGIDIPSIVYRKLDEAQEVSIRADLKKE